jgi:nitroimidazol reductase NimA-like FMN-containing flavoprotein (pyridoxamine 5'-phosphate oxidase superfamily)
VSGHEPGREASLRHLTALSTEECHALLRSRPVGRVVFVDARGPVALPVNYVVDRDDIVFRTTSSSSVVSSKYGDQVGFEVDDFDADDREGWSVLVTGHVSPVVDPADLRHVQMLRVTPWAEGDRTTYLRLRIRTLSGRRLVPDESEPPASSS